MKWKKGEKEFVVKLTFDGKNSIICRVPKPIVTLLGDPTKIKFMVGKNGITVKAHQT